MYVSRNQGGVINGVFAVLQPGFAEEFLPDNDPEVVTYLNPPKPVPAVISDRQFFQQLAVQGVITQDEAIAAVSTGTLPASMAALVSQLPSDQQFSANMLLKGAVEFRRDHPMVAVLGAAYGWTSAQLDALWSSAVVL
jgi:hypothetical protein